MTQSNVNKSPTRSQTSFGSQHTLGPLHSKLLTRAQGVPLTPDTLARMMEGQSDSSDETIRAFCEPQDPFVIHGSLAHEVGQTVKVVSAPPGFGNQMSRVIEVEDERSHDGPTTPQQDFAMPLRATGMVAAAAPCTVEARYSCDDL